AVRLLGAAPCNRAARPARLIPQHVSAQRTGGATAGSPSTVQPSRPTTCVPAARRGTRIHRFSTVFLSKEVRMRLSSILTTLALLSGGAGLAHASQIITSPPLQTANNTAGACYIRNVGTRPIDVAISPLINFTAGFRTPDFNNCSNGNDGVLVQPGHTCVLLMNTLDADVTSACTAVIGGNAKNVRGSIEVRSILPGGGAQTILADELR